MSYNLAGIVVALIVIFLCIIFLRRPRKKIFVYPRKRVRGKLFVLRCLVRGAAVVMVVLWALNIRRIDGSTPQRMAERHVSFLLDGSLSMSAIDVAPNRFQRAKELIADIVRADTGAEYNLIVFSGIPLVRVPWTHDLTGVQTVVSGMSLGDFPPTDTFLGTALGDALLLSLQQFSQLPTQTNRSIIIISDGDSNKGYDPRKTLSLLTQENIPVYFIALGDDGYEVGKDATGLPVTTSFDTELMEEFTNQTAGKLYRNPDEANISELTTAITRMNNSKLNSVVYLPQQVSLNEYLAPRLLISLLVLLLFSLTDLISTRHGLK